MTKPPRKGGLNARKHRKDLAQGGGASGSSSKTMRFRVHKVIINGKGSSDYADTDALSFLQDAGFHGVKPAENAKNHSLGHAPSNASTAFIIECDGTNSGCHCRLILSIDGVEKKELEAGRILTKFDVYAAEFPPGSVEITMHGGDYMIEMVASDKLDAIPGVPKSAHPHPPTNGAGSGSSAIVYHPPAQSAQPARQTQPTQLARSHIEPPPARPSTLVPPRPPVPVTPVVVKPPVTPPPAKPVAPPAPPAPRPPVIPPVAAKPPAPAPVPRPQLPAPRPAPPPVVPPIRPAPTMMAKAPTDSSPGPGWLHPAHNAIPQGGGIWVVRVKLGRVRVFTGQPREEFDLKDIAALGEGLKQDGQSQLITVTPVTDTPGVDWELVNGERRYRAALAAGIHELDAQVKLYKDKDAQFWDSFIMNWGSRGHTPMETSRAIAKARAAGKTFKEICIATQMSRGWVESHLRLQKLAPQLQELMRISVPKEQRLRLGMAQYLSKIPRHEDQVRIWNESKGLASQTLIRLDIERRSLPLIEAQEPSSDRRKFRKQKPSDRAERAQRALATMEADCKFLAGLTLEDIEATANKVPGGKGKETIAARVRSLSGFLKMFAARFYVPSGDDSTETPKAE